MMNRRGFSAMELAMVLTIILGMTLFVIALNSRAAQRARETSCMSNLTQLHVSSTMYAADYDGWYPRANLNGLMTYVGNQQVFSCPTAEESTPAGTLYDPEGSTYEEPGEFKVTYFYSPGHTADDLPQTILFYDDVPDRHTSETFNYVRIDGYTERAPASEYPGPPRDGNAADVPPEAPSPGCCEVDD